LEQVEIVDTDLQNKYLEEISDAYSSIEEIDRNYYKERSKAKLNLANKIEEARFKSDLSVKDIAVYFGKSRQAINKVLIDSFGVRHIEKAQAAKIGHINKNNNNNEL
jgi:hypothetical protein